MRKLLTRARKETSGLIQNLRPGSPRKLAPRNIATSARSMGVCIPCTTPRIVVGTERQDGKIQLPCCQKKRIFHANEQEVGQAGEGNQETECQRKEMLP
jgi:hypothetical protein